MKNVVPWTYAFNNRNKMQKTNQKEFRIENVIKKKEKNYMSNEKGLIIHLISGLIKMCYMKMSQYFPKPYESFRGEINVNKIKLSKFKS